MHRAKANALVFLHILLFFLATNICLAQNELSAVDFDKVKQKQIQKLIEQQSKGIDKFSELKVTVDEQTELQEFLQYEKDYIIKYDPEEVWYNYRNSDQTEIWDISKISFGLLYCRSTDSIYYSNQVLMGLEEDRIYFIGLKILNGLYHLPVAFEITKIDPEKKIIEFSYLRGGKAKGKQIIQLSETERGHTLINHKTYVKSNSKLRDKYLYPYFHNKLINEFHLNMKRIIASRAKRRQQLLAESK